MHRPPGQFHVNRSELNFGSQAGRKVSAPKWGHHRQQAFDHPQGHQVVYAQRILVVCSPIPPQTEYACPGEVLEKQKGPFRVLRWPKISPSISSYGWLEAR